MERYINRVMTKEAFIAICEGATIHTTRRGGPTVAEQFPAVAEAFEAAYPDKTVHILNEKHIAIMARQQSMNLEQKPTKPKHKRRFVVCAACRQPDSDLIFCGPRHFDMIMQRQLESAGVNGIGMEQGFIDQHGVFMDRKEAMKVAKKAGQPIDIEYGCGGNPNVLYSEGLY